MPEMNQAPVPASTGDVRADALPSYDSHIGSSVPQPESVPAPAGDVAGQVGSGVKEIPPKDLPPVFTGAQLIESMAANRVRAERADAPPSVLDVEPAPIDSAPVELVGKEKPRARPLGPSMVGSLVDREDVGRSGGDGVVDEEKLEEAPRNGDLEDSRVKRESSRDFVDRSELGKKLIEDADGNRMVRGDEFHEGINDRERRDGDEIAMLSNFDFGNKSPNQGQKAEEQAEQDVDTLNNPDASQEEREKAQNRVKEATDPANEDKSTEDQLTALESGEQITVNPNKFVYMRALLRKIEKGFGGKTGLDAFSEFQANTGLEAQVSQAISLVSSEQVNTGGAKDNVNLPPMPLLPKLGGGIFSPELRGGASNVPASISELLDQPQTKWLSTKFPEAPPAKTSEVKTLSIPNLSKLSQLTSILGKGKIDQRFWNSSPINRGLIKAAAEITKETAVPGGIGSQNRSIDRKEVRAVINEMLQVSGEDHVAVADSLSGYRMSKTDAQGLDSQYNPEDTVEAFLNYDWGGDDAVDGPNGLKVMIESAGINTYFSQLANRPDWRGTQIAVGTVAKVLGSGVALHNGEKFLGERSPGVVQALAKGLAPYHADLAGLNQFPALDALTDREQATNLVKTLLTDPVACMETTVAIKLQQETVARQYGAGLVGEEYGEIVGNLQGILEDAASKFGEDSKVLSQYKSALAAARSGLILSSGSTIASTLAGFTLGPLGSASAGILSSLIHYQVFPPENALDLKASSAAQFAKSFITLKANKNDIARAQLEGLIGRWGDVAKNSPTISQFVSSDGSIVYKGNEIKFRKAVSTLLKQFGIAPEVESFWHNFEAGRKGIRVDQLQPDSDE